jgi:hypothetical protein
VATERAQAADPVLAPGRQVGVVIATYVVLAAIGVMLGVIETFLVPLRLFDGVEGLAAVLALVVNAAVASFGGVGTRSFAGAIVPTLGWLLTVGVLISWSPGGDVVLAGKLGADPGVVVVGDAYLIAGFLAGGISLVVTARYALSNAAGWNSRRGTTPSG